MGIRHKGLRALHEIGEHGSGAGGYRLGHRRTLDADAGELRAFAGAPRPGGRETARGRIAGMIGSHACAAGRVSCMGACTFGEARPQHDL